LKAGENKDIGSPFREMTPEERRIIQEVIDNVHQQFIDAVAKGRKGKMNRTDVVKLADGRIFTGSRPRSLGSWTGWGTLTIPSICGPARRDQRETKRRLSQEKIFGLGPSPARDGFSHCENAEREGF